MAQLTSKRISQIATAAERLAQDLAQSGRAQEAAYFNTRAQQLRQALNGQQSISAPEGGVAQSARDLLAEIEAVTNAAGLGIDAYLGTRAAGTWWERNQTWILVGAGGAVLTWIAYGFFKSWVQGKVIGRSLRSVFDSQKNIGG